MSKEISRDIDKIFVLMEDNLHRDLIERIVKQSYNLHNMSIIKIQKNIKYKLNLEFLVQNEVIFAHEYLKFLIDMI